MKRLLLRKYPLLVFMAVSAVYTAPFAFLTIAGEIRDASALIMIHPFFFGMPWVFIYFLFDIPAMDSNPLSIPGLLLFMIPVYINIYIIIKILSRVIKIPEERN